MYKPKRPIGWGLCLVMTLLLVVISVQTNRARAAINEQIPFYGTLQNTSGTNLSGTYDMTFRFYDSSSGGTLLDTSTHTASNGNAVTVTNGEFSASLGSGAGNALDGLDFNAANIYVGLTIGADSEMTPRERLAAAPYAFNTDTLDGYDSLDLLRLNATNTIVASASTPLLTIRQNGTGDILNILDGVTEVFTILDGGNVGVGDTSPTSKLSIGGDISVTGAYRDTSGDAGISGQVLLSTLSGTNWTATSSLGITASLSNNSVTPNNLLTTGQADEYCLTYETTGSIWEWQTCGGGGSLFTDGGATTYLTSLTDSLAIGTNTATDKLTVVGRINLVGPSAAISFDGVPSLFSSSTVESIGFGGGTSDSWDSDSWGLTFIGFRAGEQASTTPFNLFESTYIGQYAGYGASADGSVIIGAYSGYTAPGDYTVTIGYNAGSQNSGDYNNNIGYYTGDATSGNYNNILGYESGLNNSGDENEILGRRSAYSNSGDRNIILGYNAGYTNRGDSNIIIGELAGQSNKGLENILIGNSVGLNNIGTTSIIIGSTAGQDNSGLNANMIGFGAGVQNIGDNVNLYGLYAGATNVGDYVDAIGNQALEQNTGSYTVGIGYRAGQFNRGDYNNFVGYEAGNDESDGDYNDFMGYQAGKYINSTSTVAVGGLAIRGGVTTAVNILNSVALGYRAGYNIRSGSDNNIFLGYQAGDNITTGDNNIIIGYDVDHVSAAVSNRLNIGNLIFGTGVDGTSATLSTGNIGISTSSPNQKLTIMRNTAAATNDAAIELSGASGSTYKWTIGMDHSDGGKFKIASSSVLGTNDRFVINGAGRVGIATTSPWQELSVTGDIAYTGVLYGADADLTGTVNLASAAYISSVGLARMEDGSAGAPSLSFENDTNSGFWIPGADTVALATAGTERLRVTAAGNLGVGTTTPAQKLQVLGDIRVGTTGSNGCLENFGGGVIGGTCSSDERLKTDIEEFGDSDGSYLEGIVALKPVSYRWNNLAASLYKKNGEINNFGLIAQNVEEEFPELVSLNRDGYRQVDFGALPFYMIEAIKELWMKVSGLEEKVQEIDDLRERIERLEAKDNIEYVPPQPVTPEPSGQPEDSESQSVTPPESVESEGVQTIPESPENLPAVAEGGTGL